MATVFDVAKYILTKTGRVSTFKLQKLVYYSQAWSLVWDDKPLFVSKIYAWANGPVCKDLYAFHKGAFEIEAADFEKCSCGDISKLDESQKETINLVLKSYMGFTGQELSQITHTEKPWIDARNGLPFGERGDVEITQEAMVEYYSAMYANQISGQL